MNSYMCTVTINILVIAETEEKARDRVRDIIGTEPSITDIHVELEEEDVEEEE